MTPFAARFSAHRLLAGVMVAAGLVSSLSAQAAWTTVMADDPLNPATRPESRNAGGFAGDLLDRLYVFGGKTDATGADGTFWSYNGTTQTWTQLFGTVSNPLPPARRQGGMALDPTRNKLVLFGGFTGSLPWFDDVWEFDLGTQLWTDVTPAPGTGPTPRGRFAMSYDPINAQVVVFGGTNTTGTNGSAVGDNLLWGWNGSAWTQLDSGTGPSARIDSMMAWGPSGEVLLFGGYQGSTETWKWLGNGMGGGTWTQVSTATIPETIGVNGGGLVFDLVRGRFVMFGGSPGATTTRLDVTWEFDGTDWIGRGSSGLAPRRQPHIAYLPGLGKTVMFGGLSDSANGSRLNDLTEYQTNALATFTPFGAGCPTSLGVPNLSATTLPWIGTGFKLAVNNVPSATGTAFLLTGVAPITVPLSALGIGDPGCNVLVDPIPPAFLIGMAAASPTTWDATLPIPPVAVLVGASLLHQAVVIDFGPARTYVSNRGDSVLGAP